MFRAFGNCFLIISLFWVLGLIYFVNIVDGQETPDRLAVIESDAFIVFTGGSTRIDKGFELLSDSPNATLLISGVFESTTLSDLVATSDYASTNSRYFEEHCCIILDYKSQTTQDNVAFSHDWIAQNSSMKNVMIVTSAYHIPRVQLLFRQLDRLQQQLYFYPIRQRDEWRTPRYWGHILNEYHKTIYTYSLAFVNSITDN